ncbi:MarR family winged helix-turn-helix transcriptional regulator [Frigoribacterium sp. VKM Ac-2836]|uniref:MarR family winged helix-turn-helix transcriptional regulator n=1 Tax=Frigoribacterium sp. VKM Ac-2836 TaxID=2739014 RepID=UPI001567904C|nr:MarR family transcriptional regulator [Frigoribacterium sp. VKM Ac-2836]NRD26194.1 MarR family transcriptional regulator [Frigoribacterium sp. VKM Ac-2836]
MPHLPDSEAARDLDDVLTWNVVRVARFVGNRLAERLADLGLNPIQFGVLAFLEREGELTTAEIARAVLLRPQSVAPLLDGLEARDLIRRVGDRGKGRRNPVRMTEAGREVLVQAWVIALAANDLGDAALSAHESKELNRLLLKIALATEP